MGLFHANDSLNWNSNKLTIIMSNAVVNHNCNAGPGMSWRISCGFQIQDMGFIMSNHDPCHLNLAHSVSADIICGSMRLILQCL